MKNKQNNGFIKNPFLYILIIVVLVTGFQYFFSGDTGGRSQQINYTELVKEIKENNVTEMSYQPNGSVVEISGTYKTPQESKEDTGILFFTPNVSKVERFTSIILPSDITISDLQKLASEINLPNHNIHFGLVGTSDSFISNKELKKGILKNFPNMQVVEMEAAAIAQTCYQFGTKFIVCRSVSDKAEEGTRVTFDEFLQIAAVNSSILTTELIKKL